MELTAEPTVEVNPEGTPKRLPETMAEIADVETMADWNAMAGQFCLGQEKMANFLAIVENQVGMRRLLQIDHGKPLASMDAKASRIVFRGVRVPGKVPSGTWSDRRSGWYAKKFQARRTGCKKAGLTKS